MKATSQATWNANRTAAKMLLVAGLSLCAVLTVGVPTQAQGPGSRRITPTRNTFIPAYPTRTGQAANGQPLSNSALNTPMAAGSTGGNGGTGAPPGNNNAQTPVAAGIILAGDASTGRILIQSSFNGSRQILQISNATQFVTQTPITADELQVGEQVRIQGVAGNTTSATITASAITVGQIPDFMQANRASGASGMNANTNTNGNAGRSANAGRNTGAARNASTSSASSAAATITINGQITSLSPLTVTLNSDVTVTVTPTSQTQVSHVKPLLFRNLQVGDHLMAIGQAVTGGTMFATSVAINM